jgi:hypothetical protein
MAPATGAVQAALFHQTCHDGRIDANHNHCAVEARTPAAQKNAALPPRFQFNR